MILFQLLSMLRVETLRMFVSKECERAEKRRVSDELFSHCLQWLRMHCAQVDVSNFLCPIIRKF